MWNDPVTMRNLYELNTVFASLWFGILKHSSKRKAALREHQVTRTQKTGNTISEIAFIMLMQLSSVSPFPNSRSFNKRIIFQKTSTRSGNTSRICLEEDTIFEIANPAFAVEMEFDVVNEAALAEGCWIKECEYCPEEFKPLHKIPRSYWNDLKQFFLHVH